MRCAACLVMSLIEPDPTAISALASALRPITRRTASMSGWGASSITTELTRWRVDSTCATALPMTRAVAGSMTTARCPPRSSFETSSAAARVRLLSITTLRTGTDRTPGPSGFGKVPASMRSRVCCASSDRGSGADGWQRLRRDRHTSEGCPPAATGWSPWWD